MKLFVNLFPFLHYLHWELPIIGYYKTLTHAILESKLTKLQRIDYPEYINVLDFYITCVLAGSNTITYLEFRGADETDENIMIVMNTAQYPINWIYFHH